MHGGISIQSHLNNTLAYSDIEAKENSIKEIINKVNLMNTTIQKHEEIALDFYKNLKYKTKEEIQDYILNVALIFHDITNEL